MTAIPPSPARRPASAVSFPSGVRSRVPAAKALLYILLKNVSDGNHFGSFYGNQNVHLKFLNQNGRQFRLHSVRDLLIHRGSRESMAQACMGRKTRVLGNSLRPVAMPAARHALCYRSSFIIRSSKLTSRVEDAAINPKFSNNVDKNSRVACRCYVFK